jgi:hypothetical protein
MIDNNIDQIDLEIKTLEKLLYYLEDSLFVEKIKITNPLESVKQSLDSFCENTKKLKIYK